MSPALAFGVIAFIVILVGGAAVKVNDSITQRARQLKSRETRRRWQ